MAAKKVCNPEPPMTWPESEADRKFDRDASRGIQLLIIAVSFMFGCGITAAWNHSSDKPSEPADIEGIHADISNLESIANNHAKKFNNLDTWITFLDQQQLEYKSVTRDNVYRLSLIESEIRKMEEKGSHGE